MATTNNVIVPNQPVTDGTVNPPQCFNTVWKLTRALKKGGWKYKASGDGTSKDTSGLPNSDLWGNAGTTSNAGAAAANITANSRGRATVTGLSGIVAADKGRFLVISGSGSSNDGYHQIEEVLSSSSVKIDARTVTITAPDANNGALTWSIVDPLGTSYPAGLTSVAAWWTAQGPSVIRVPITAAPVAGGGGFVFLRGENIVQATSGFEGEIVGVVFNVSSGYLVVLPRLRGTGGGVFGLTTGQVFTGASSGATVTQDGTALEYRYEVTFVKAANATQGLVWFTQPEPVAEGAVNLFSSLAVSAAGCTATVPPGGGGTGNTFPVLGWVALGTGTTVAAAVQWATTSAFASAWGNAHIIVTDAIEEEDHSPDGTWLWLCGTNASNAPAGGMLRHFGFMRCDDVEDGDLSPFLSVVAGQVKTVGANNRTSGGTTESVANDGLSASGVISAAATRTHLAGWVRRGLSNERFQEFEFALLRPLQSAQEILVQINVGQSDLIVTAPVATFVREPIWAAITTTGFKARKGTLRWMSAVGPGGNLGRLYDTDRWVQASSSNGAFVVGPWDGSTIAIVN